MESPAVAIATHMLEVSFSPRTASEAIKCHCFAVPSPEDASILTGARTHHAIHPPLLRRKKRANHEIHKRRDGDAGKPVIFQ